MKMKCQWRMGNGGFSWCLPYLQQDKLHRDKIKQAFPKEPDLDSSGQAT